MGTWSRCLMSAAIGLAFLNSGLRAQVAPSEESIEAAKQKGIAFLKTSTQTSLGQDALVAAVLLKSGETLDQPVVKKAIDRIVARVQSSTYSPEQARSVTEVYDAGVCLIALGNADPDAYKPQMEAITQWLIDKQTKEGGWDYPDLVGGDTSVTQYAVLGLWEASRAGIRVPLSVWSKVAGWHISKQNTDGGFAYKPGNGQHQPQSTHTMTAAGTGSLYVARLHLYPRAAGLLRPEPEEKTVEKDANGNPLPRKRKRRFGFLYPVVPGQEDTVPELEGRAASAVAQKPGDNVVSVPQASIDRAIERSTAWLEKNWTLKPLSQWQMYYLYCIERVGALSGAATIGDDDWYASGAGLLLQSQGADGAWTDGSGRHPGTAFGVLFLTRATSKMVNIPHRTPKPKLGTGLLAGGRGLPDNLAQLQVDQGEVTVKKLKGPVADLLAELEKGDGVQIESAQAGLVEQVLLDKPDELIGQKDRLIKLTKDPRAEVRRTAYWAIGRTDDLLLSPLLVAGLEDADYDCVVEAQRGLIFISRSPAEADLPEELTPELRQSLVAKWKAWYLRMRPYEQRDDLTPQPGAAKPAKRP